MGPCLTPPTQLPETQWILIPQDTPDTSASSFGQGNHLAEACLLTPRRTPPITWSPPSGPPPQAPAGRPRRQHGKARLCQPWWPQKCSMELIKNLTALEAIHLPAHCQYPNVGAQSCLYCSSLPVAAVLPFDFPQPYLKFAVQEDLQIETSPFLPPLSSTLQKVKTF